MTDTPSRLHIAVLSGSGMSLRYKVQEQPHMGSDPWVPQEKYDQLKRELREVHALVRAKDDIIAGYQNQSLPDLTAVYLAGATQKLTVQSAAKFLLDALPSTFAAADPGLDTEARRAAHRYVSAAPAEAHATSVQFYAVLSALHALAGDQP